MCAKFLRGQLDSEVIEIFGECPTHMSLRPVREATAEWRKVTICTDLAKVGKLLLHNETTYFHDEKY